MESLTETIVIKYHDKNLKKVEQLDVGNWIDLRAAETTGLKKGEHKLISLGVSMQIPNGYEAIIVPRSSTLKTFGVIQGNHFGVVDTSYSGDGDIWMFSAYAVRDTQINFNDRICQFRILKRQPQIIFTEVETLGNPDRGGFGSTGKC